MGEKVTKTVKVDRSTAENWESYVDENETFDSISHLIRLSVHREMQGKYNEPQRTVDADGGAAGANSGEALTILRKLQTSVDGLENRLSTIERIDKAEASYDLQKAIYSFLPEKQDESRVNQWGMTAGELSQKLGADESEVRDTLERLADTGEVRSLSGGPENETYWFKRGQ